MNYRIDAYLTANRAVDASQTYIMGLSQYVTGLSFTTALEGGYLTAVLDLVMRDADAWNLLNRLGTRVVLVNPHAANSDMIIWEGLAYAVTLDDGKNAVNRSLANTYNRVRVTYSTITYDANNLPIFGTQITTAGADDTASQALYGIRELNYIIGGTDATSAAALRDTLLLKYKNPLTVPTRAQRGGGGDPSMIRVTLECAGIWETLDKRFYTQTALTANANIDVIVEACLTSVAQMANSDQSNVAVNTQQRSLYSQGNVTAQVYLSGLSALGGPNNRRFYFGFYEQGKPYYIEEPTAVAYRARRLDPSEAIYDAVTGTVVPPWLVLPGRIIRIDDLVPDTSTYSTALSDPRAWLIGQVTFTAPGLVELTPYVDDPAQLSLARMGLSQIG